MLKNSIVLFLNLLQSPYPLYFPNLKSTERRQHDDDDDFYRDEERDDDDVYGNDEDDHHDVKRLWLKGPGASGNGFSDDDHNDDDDDEKNGDYYIEEKFFNNNQDADELDDLLNTFFDKVRFHRLFTKIFLLILALKYNQLIMCLLMIPKRNVLKLFNCNA